MPNNETYLKCSKKYLFFGRKTKIDFNNSMTLAKFKKEKTKHTRNNEERERKQKNGGREEGIGKGSCDERNEGRIGRNEEEGRENSKREDE
jgi:hypothetical protein